MLFIEVDTLRLYVRIFIFLFLAMPKYSNLFELNSNSQWNKRGLVWLVSQFSHLNMKFIVCYYFSTYVFSASTPAERAEWLDCLEVSSIFRSYTLKYNFNEITHRGVFDEIINFVCYPWFHNIVYSG